MNTPTQSGFPRWFFALLGTAVLLAVLFPVGVFTLIRVIGSDAKEEAVTLLSQSDVVRADIGEPAKAGFIGSSNVRLSGDSGTAEFTIPMKGPQGSGRGHVRLTKSGGRWTVEQAHWTFGGRTTTLVEPAPSYYLPSPSAAYQETAVAE